MTYSQHSIYRPAYYRIPSTIPQTNNDMDITTSPIVVPSMSQEYKQIVNHNYYQYTTPMQESTTFDDFTSNFLVKDVFFSPAVMMTPREMSPCVSSASSTCDNDSVYETPSELLDEEHLFDFGLDLATSSPDSNMTVTSSYEEIMPSSPLSPSSSSSSSTTTNNSKRRRCSDSILLNKKKKAKTNPSLRTSRPVNMPSLVFEQIDEEQPKKKAKKPCNKKETVKEQTMDYHHLPKASPRSTSYPTIYQKLTKANIDWCRYCGTTEGVNWRPGPWGKRTLCNKHGCDYKGYGFACKLPRLDLTGFIKESIDDRERPVLQLFCSGCQGKESWEGNVLVRCEGCPKAYHQSCCPEQLSDEFINSDQSWFCNSECSENVARKRIVVELPRKRLPLMCAPSKLISLESRLTTRNLRESPASQ